eukprot:scaffold436608_cov18-Prasinocladus_malaysianus.AAC.1
MAVALREMEESQNAVDGTVQATEELEHTCPCECCVAYHDRQGNHLEGEAAPSSKPPLAGNDETSASGSHDISPPVGLPATMAILLSKLTRLSIHHFSRLLFRRSREYMARKRREKLLQTGRACIFIASLYLCS